MLDRSALFNSTTGNCVPLQTKNWGESFYWKETSAQAFSCEYWKIFKNTYFEEHLRTAASDVRRVTVSFVNKIE